MHSVTVFLLVAVSTVSVISTQSPISSMFETVLTNVLTTDRDQCMLRLFCEIGANRPLFGAYGQRISNFFSGFTAATPTQTPTQQSSEIIVLVSDNEFDQLKNQSTKDLEGRHLGSNVLFVSLQNFTNLRNQNQTNPFRKHHHHRRNDTIVLFNKHFQGRHGHHNNIVFVSSQEFERLKNESVLVPKHHFLMNQTTFHHKHRINAGRGIHFNRRNQTTFLHKHRINAGRALNETYPSDVKIVVVFENIQRTVFKATLNAEFNFENSTRTFTTLSGRTLYGPATSIFNQAYFLGLTQGSASCNATFSNCTTNIGDIAAFARTLYPF